MNSHSAPSAQKELRFEFGKNWLRYLNVVTEDHVREAERSLIESLGGINSLKGKSFLDVGCGSGLFSLAAHRLGAEVHSFDFDAQSVACTRKIKERFASKGSKWTIEQGSILDSDYIASLGTFDIVYSWGVLHHTGQMWDALTNAAILVKQGGKLFIAIYNDQGLLSVAWRGIKRGYCSGTAGKVLMTSIMVPALAMRALVVDVLRLRNPVKRYIQYRQSRGMSIFHDWIDWLGGYPFEVARPEEIIHFYRKSAFTLERLRTVGGRMGCNEFIFGVPA